MKCVICKHGDTSAGMTTVTLTRGEATVVIKNVPAEICDNCGEYYLDDAVSQHVLTIAERVIENAAEVEVVQYAA